MNTDSVTDTPLVLTTGIFNDSDTLSAALETLDIPVTHRRELNPKTMNDGDWDEILSLVLSTTRVITV